MGIFEVMMALFSAAILASLVMAVNSQSELGGLKDGWTMAFNFKQKEVCIGALTAIVAIATIISIITH